MSIQTDTKNFLATNKIRQQDFAIFVGVNYAALSRFLNNEGHSIAERIAPYVYGRKPLPAELIASPTSESEQSEVQDA